MAKTKVCKECGKRRPIEKFYAHPKMKDGRINKCEACVRAGVKANYRKNIERYKAYEKERTNEPNRMEARREYQRSEAGQERHVAANRAWRNRNPAKAKAQNATRRAVEKGLLVKWPVCAMPECEESRVEAHHYDYSSPLCVTWLCSKHHKEAHAIVGFRNTGGY